MVGARVFYLDGPGELIGAFRSWRAGVPDPTQTDATFSGQLFDVVTELGLTAHAVAWPKSEPMRLHDGTFVVEHRRAPELGVGAVSVLQQAKWATELTRVCLKSGAKIAVLAGGPYPFLFAPLRAAGVHIVPVLHNTLWPAGFKPVGRTATLIHEAHRSFYEHIAEATLVVSPEIERQVLSLAPRPRGPIAQFRPTYHGMLAAPPAAPPATPMQVLFAGRLDHQKGVFDLVRVARTLEAQRPGAFQFTVCGTGPAAGELERTVTSAGLTHVVTLAGQLPRVGFLAQLARTDVAIVPTTARFPEGLNRVALEAALSGRPTIVSSTTPAGEVLGGAAVTVRCGDIDGYARELLRLRETPGLYAAMSASAVHASRHLLDAKLSFRAVLERTLRTVLARA